jgi:putative transposase
MPFRLPLHAYQEQTAFFVTSNTFHRIKAFTQPDVADKAIQELKKAAIKYGWKVYVFCFMPDHLHFLTMPNGPKTNKNSLIRLMSGFKQTTGYWYAQKYGTPLWHKSYHDRAVRGEEEFVAFFNYILENPVKAGLVAHWKDYPYSGIDTQLEG